MSLVYRFSDVLRAQLAVDELIAHGITANLTGGSLATLGPYAGSGIGSPHDVNVADKADLPLAREILAVMNAESVDPGWESQAQPDLARLDVNLRVACPQCQYEFLRLGDEAHGPECGNNFDLLSLILTQHGPTQHGPEALADCDDNMDDSESAE